MVVQRQIWVEAAASIILVGLSACAPTEPPESQRPVTPDPAPAPLNAAPGSADAVEEPSAGPPTESVHDSQVGDEKETLFAGTQFPPPDPGAPHERSKQKGDGVFVPMFARAPDLQLDKRLEQESTPPDFAQGVARRLVIHPHEASRFIKLSVAAFDLRELSVAHRPGAEDVKDVGHDELAPQAGLIPEAQRQDLLAVFNGGFQPRHGRWGMLSLGEQLIPPRDDACTVAILDDGTVRIGPWPEIEKLDGVVAYRQTPPCLVHGGQVHQKLDDEGAVNRRPWAGQQKDRKTRRRSAVGVSKDGRALFYVLGTETEPELLAAGMRHVGAHSAAQLDINWNWTRLFLFDEIDGEIRPVGALEENMAKDKGEYIYRPGKRGFFYLVRRAPH